MKNINATKGTSRMATFRMADFSTVFAVCATEVLVSTVTPGG